MRITLDTNQLVRSLMRPPQLATFIMAWEAKRFDVVCSQELLDEYERVLDYPEIARLIYPELLRTFHSHLIQDVNLVKIPYISPLCRDPDDDIVIATAVFGEVDFLLTEDNDLRTPEIIDVLQQAGIQLISFNELVLLLDQ
jgi:hypothetical protein